MEYWNTGIMEYWNTGMMEYWEKRGAKQVYDEMGNGYMVIWLYC